MQRETVGGKLRGLTGLLFAGAMFSWLTWAAPAHAACTNDTDCPTTTCGGQVCQWSSATVHDCVAAGTDPQGSDGWCTTSADCKCMGEGATCGVDHCTFTLPPDGGGAAATDAGTTASSSGGYASSSGAASSSGGYASSSGATGSSGSSSGTTTSGGGSSSGETLPDANIPSGSTTSGNSGGCSVTTTTGAGSASGFALACLGLVGVVRRRRHRPQAAARG